MALQERPVIGLECSAYYNTGTDAIPVWVLVTKIIDAKINMPKDMAEMASRQSKYKFKHSALRELSADVSYRKKNGTDTVFDKLQGDYHADTQTQYAFLDDIITETGAQGPKFFGEVADMSFEQNLGDAELYNFKIEACYTEEASALVEPSWHTV